MDLMIEAKDKEQAVFELRRKWGVEGGLPSDWILKGEKMDEERDIPSEQGWKVYYGEGEEWRFKPPLKMPVRIKKSLDKLEKQRSKVPEMDAQEEMARLEAEKKIILLEWERERRIKWGLETKPIKAELKTEDVAVVKGTPKRTPGRKDRKKENKEEEDAIAEWIPSKKASERKIAPQRKSQPIGDRDGEMVTQPSQIRVKGTRMQKNRRERMSIDTDVNSGGNITNGGERKRSRRL